MTRAPRRWLAELTPAHGTEVEGLLNLPAGLDVWEHHGNTLIVAAEATQLEDLERRRLATVVWLRPVEEFTGPESGETSKNRKSVEAPENKEE
jgi:hypothetical protein